MLNGAQHDSETRSLRDTYVTQHEFRPVVDKVSELSENYASLATMVKSMDKNLTEINKNIGILVDEKNYMRGVKRGMYIVGMGAITLVTLDYAHVFKNLAKLFHG